MEGLIIFILGLIIGSFLNVCIFRIPKEESIAYPPSHCVKCGQVLKWYDLIPVLSYFFLRGKCRNCKDSISIRYPIMELVAGVLFYGLYLKYGISVELIKYLFLTAILIVIAMIDFDTTDVYFKTTATGVTAGIIFMIIEHFYHFPVLTYVYGGLLSGGVIALIVVVTKGMGWGDVEICLLSGIFLGLKFSILMLFFSFIFGGLGGLLLILLKIKSRKDYISFGPFISIAAIFTLFFGNEILMWYL